MRGVAQRMKITPKHAEMEVWMKANALKILLGNDETGAKTPQEPLIYG